MAVDSLRETRHINRISKNDLSVLWSAQSYRPDVTKAVRKIRNMTWRPLAQLCVNAIGPGPHPNFTSTGHPCLKTKNVLGVVVDASEVDFTEPFNTIRWPHYCIEREDLVLNVTGAGSIGRVGMYFGEDRPLTNQHLARLSITPSVDAAFVCAFLASWWGERALEQGISGSTGQLNLVNDHIRQLPVPVPDIASQRYIGDKVRQAERLRARARKLEQESATFFRIAEWTQPRAGHRRAYVAARRVMRGERLDAPFYDPAHDALEAVLQARGALPLSELASLVEKRWKRVGEEFAYFEIGELDIASGVLSPSRLPVSAAPSRAQICVEPWDVLVSTVRPNRKNVGLVPASIERLALVASTGFAALRFSTLEQAVFYHAFLRSDAATQQLMRWNSGATYPAIENDVPLRVLAPSFDDDVVQQKGARWLQKFRALDASERLTTASKLLVEHLIDGRLTEADLVAAQKGLEAGNRDADRAILQTLRQGEGADAAPLIPDIDTLYALLDEPDEGSHT